MADLRKLEFFLLRYAPDAVKDEFVNIGIVMVEPGANGGGFAEARFTRDWRRLLCLDPQADIEMLEALQREVSQQVMGASSHDVLLYQLQDSFSNVIQLSPMKACLAEEPAKEIETLAKLYFEGPKAASRREASGRQRILGQMRTAFQQAGIWKMLDHDISVTRYTKTGDPFKFDFGYRVGSTIKLFQAASMKPSVDQAVTLAARYPKIASRMLELMSAHPFLTAVVEDELDRTAQQVQFAMDMLAEAGITVAASGEMPAIAETARAELRA